MKDITYKASCVVSFALKAFIAAQAYSKTHSVLAAVLALLASDLAVTAIALWLSKADVREGIEATAQKVDGFIRERMDLQMLVLASIGILIKAL